MTHQDSMLKPQHRSRETKKAGSLLCVPLTHNPDLSQARMWCARDRFRRARGAAITIETAVRGHQARAAYTRAYLR
jgi:hypothetical protein